MLFITPREYRPAKKNLEELVHYLSVDLVATLRNFSAGMTRLTLGDNFSGWIEKDITIAASSELEIKNRIGKIPNYKLILRGGIGSELIVDGVNEWTEKSVYLQNQGINPVQITVIFLV